MPYYHKRCGGEIGLWTRRCHKCKKQWPFWTLFMPKPPGDMFYVVGDLPKAKKGKTTYASWADKMPGAAFVASHLPNVPRWARITIVLIIICIIILVIRLLV